MPEVQTDPTQQYHKRLLTAEIGSTVEIPTGAIGIHLQEISPFFNSVLVTYFEPTDNEPDFLNEMTVHAVEYDDEGAVEIPYYAVAPTTGDTHDRVSERAFYLA